MKALLMSVVLLILLCTLQMLHAPTAKRAKKKKNKNKRTTNPSLSAVDVERTQPDGRQYRHLGLLTNGFEALLISDPTIEKVL